MIITKIAGGLGNQMFQYAFGKYLSHKYQDELFIDDRSYSLDIKRQLQLREFTQITLNSDFTSYIKNKSLEIIQDDFVFKQFDKTSDVLYLDGYWQSDKYFREIDNIIKKDFDLEDISKKLVNSQIDLNKKNVSIHIRRTDYVESNGYHPVLPISYYEKAFEIIGNYDNLYVFSDDINWCKSNLKFDKMRFSDNNTAIQDLSLMSLCQDNIIANSTFSWWAAWLNSNNNKKVIAPKLWFGTHVNLNSSDIIPEDWIKI